MIDNQGFRLNVGMVLSNRQGKLFWGRRAGQRGWQFPQGGILENETPADAMYRELQEEVGLSPDRVQILAENPQWLRYRLPACYIRPNVQPLCIGQKQKWFLLRLLSDEASIDLNTSLKPEFDTWRWVSYWYPFHSVVSFKRHVYKQALQHFAPFNFNQRLAKK